MRIVEVFLEKSRKSRQIIVEIGKVVQLQVKFKYQNVAFYRISVEFVYISVVQLARTRSSSHVSVSLLHGLPGLHLSFRVSCLVIFTLINIKSNLNTLRFSLWIWRTGLTRFLSISAISPGFFSNGVTGWVSSILLYWVITCQTCL